MKAAENQTKSENSKSGLYEELYKINFVRTLQKDNNKIKREPFKQIDLNQKISLKIDMKDTASTFY